MRIALIHAWVGGPAGGGGGSRLMLDLAVKLQALGHDVVVACRDHDPDEQHLGAGQLDIRSVRRETFSAINGARDALQRFWIDMRAVADLVPADADVVNAHEWPALHAGRLAASRTGAALVWHRNDHTIFERAVIPDVRHDGRVGRLSRTLRAAGGLGDFLDARRAEAIVTIDEPSRRMAERAYRRPVDCVPAPPADHFFDPPDRDGARRMLGVGQGTFLALGVGVMNPHRRFEDFVDALARLDASEVRGLILGSDHVDPEYGRAIAARVRKLGLEKIVELPLRSVSEEHLRAAYAAADVFIFPNDHRQSWGLAPLEALAAGTPVVLSREAGVAAVLAGQPGVEVVDARSPDQIAAAVERIRARPREELTHETRRWVRDELGSERYARRILAIYGRCCARSGRSVSTI